MFVLGEFPKEADASELKRRGSLRGEGSAMAWRRPAPRDEARGAAASDRRRERRADANMAIVLDLAPFLLQTLTPPFRRDSILPSFPLLIPVRYIEMPDIVVPAKNLYGLLFRSYGPLGTFTAQVGLLSLHDLAGGRSGAVSHPLLLSRCRSVGIRPHGVPPAAGGRAPVDAPRLGHLHTVLLLASSAARR